MNGIRTAYSKVFALVDSGEWYARLNHADRGLMDDFENQLIDRIDRAHLALTLAIPFMMVSPTWAALPFLFCCGWVVHTRAHFKEPLLAALARQDMHMNADHKGV